MYVEKVFSDEKFIICSFLLMVCQSTDFSETTENKSVLLRRSAILNHFVFIVLL